MAKISIIVPIYNASPYLESCVESIRQQTFSNLEILLINDGSTDQSGELCEQIGAKDKRIRVIHQKNGGVSAARNHGLQLATGDYIGFVDSDDTVAPDMFELLYYNCDAFGAQVSICSVNQVLNGGVNDSTATDIRKDTPRVLEKQDAIGRLIDGTLNFGVYNKIYQSSIAKNFSFEGAIFEDLYYCFNVFMSAKNFVYSDSAKYNYIRRETSVSASKFDERYLQMTEVTGKILSTIQKKAPENIVDAKMLFIVSNISVINLILLSDPEKYQSELKQAKQQLRNHRQFIFQNGKVDLKYRFATYLINKSPMSYRSLMYLYCKLTGSDVIQRI